MRQYLVDDNFIRRFEQMERWVRNFRGAGVTNTPEGATISAPRDRVLLPPGVGRGLFPVTLSHTGGTNGSQVAAASYLYTAYHETTGEEVATNVSPAVARELGTRTVATWGMGYFNSSGTFILAIHNERTGRGGC